MTARIIHSDVSGYLDGEKVADEETCVVFSDLARVAAIKLLGSMSRNAYTDKGLSEREIHALEGLYYLLQT